MTRMTLTGGRGWLTARAAASISRIDAELGHRLQITEAGRTWAQQNTKWLRYQRQGHPIALHPDTPSVHQKGEAIDSDEAQRHLALMTRHGWRRTVYRNGKLVEPWHFEYFINLDTRRHAPAGTETPTKTPDPLPEEDDMKPKLIHRNTGGDEWMLVHPDYRGDTDQERGYIVTTSEPRAIAWARVHGNGWAGTLTGPGGRYTADVNRADYIEIQAAARAEYNAKHAAA